MTGDTAGYSVQSVETCSCMQRRVEQKRLVVQRQLARSLVIRMSVSVKFSQPENC